MSTPENKPSTSYSPPNHATHVGIAIVLVVIAMIATAFLAKAGWVPYEMLIFISGTVGGVVNSFRRVQSLTTAKNREINATTDRLVTIQIYISPFVGGIFAFVLYTIFMAGIVQGSLFPAFASGAQQFRNWNDFAFMNVPATNADVAKTLVWAFMAGFSEGLVPNFISKIVKDSGEDGTADR